MHIDMIFPKITFDNTSKMEAKMTPSVDSTYPIMNMSLAGSSKMLHNIFIVVPLILSLSM